MTEDGGQNKPGQGGIFVINHSSFGIGYIGEEFSEAGGFSRQ